jgi:hypothetical protein
MFIDIGFHFSNRSGEALRHRRWKSNTFGRNVSCDQKAGASRLIGIIQAICDGSQKAPSPQTVEPGYLRT